MFVDCPLQSDIYVPICSKKTLTVNASSPYANAVYSYQWYLNGIKLDGETNNSIETNRINYWETYVCTVTLEYKGYKQSKDVQFDICGRNGYSFNPNFEDFVPLGTALSLNPTVTKGTLSTFWNDNNDTCVSKDEASFTPDKTGRYYARYIYNESESSYRAVSVYVNKGTLIEKEPLAFSLEAGEYAGYTFTATKTGKYYLYSLGDDDTYGYLVDNKGRMLKSNDDSGDGNNFKITYNLVAGQTYTVVVRSYYSKVCTGTLMAEFAGVCAHPFVAPKGGTDSTCTANGYTGDNCCELCNEKISDGTVIPAKGHTLSVINKSQASFNQDGCRGDKVCTTCGQVIEQGAVISRIKSVTLKKQNLTYTGKNVKPVVVVKDASGKEIASSNYTVTYSKNLKSIGSKTVKIKFNGEYSGSKTLNYKVVPKNVPAFNVTVKSKSFKVSWKKQTKQTSGYQISYSTNKKFNKAKTVNISKNMISNKTIKSLKKGSTYYVRIRTYKKVGKKNYYSSWSKTKKVKIKK